MFASKSRVESVIRFFLVVILLFSVLPESHAQAQKELNELGSHRLGLLSWFTCQPWFFSRALIRR